MVKFNKRVFIPEALTKFVARNRGREVAQQQDQDLKRLLLELDTASRFTHLSGMEISLKSSKPNRAVPITPL